MGHIVDIINDIGEEITIRNVSKTNSSWGDATETLTDVTVSSHVQIMSGDDEEVEEGILERGDLIAFFDPLDTNAAYFKLGNRISYDSRWYEIVDVIKEPSQIGGGHVEVHARKI